MEPRLNTCINYDVFTRKPDSARRLWFQLCCEKPRTFQGHRHSRTR